MSQPDTSEQTIFLGRAAHEWLVGYTHNIKLDSLSVSPRAFVEKDPVGYTLCLEVREYISKNLGPEHESAVSVRVKGNKLYVERQVGDIATAAGRQISGCLNVERQASDFATAALFWTITPTARKLISEVVEGKRVIGYDPIPLYLSTSGYVATSPPRKRKRNKPLVPHPRAATELIPHKV